MNLEELYQATGLSPTRFVQAVNHVAKTHFTPKKFAKYLKGQDSYSDGVYAMFCEGAQKVLNEALPLHDTMMDDTGYANINPLVIAFYNAVKNDPQVMADFEWWASTCKANPKLNLISEAFFD